jgi:glucose-6-phosphate dehydrogenase assembly protein OpcA
MAATLQPEKILKELRELWVELGQGQAGENHEAGGGVLRACAMTLLVAAEPDGGGRDAEAAHRTIGVLMHDQPSRAIVIVPREGGEGDVTELRARVFSECWMPFGSQQQICAEGIEISTDAEQTDEVARLLVPLIAPDLPVMLWCRGPQAFRDRSLDPLFALADKIIFDTARVRHASSAIEFLRRMRHSSHGRPRIADLAWTRLTGWREAVAHELGGGFEPGEARVTAARVTHCGEKPGTSALYFARWIEKALPAATVTLEPAAADAANTAAVGLCGVTFTRVAGEIAIHQKDAASLEVREGAKTYASPLPGVSEEVLLGEELSILGSDPVFDRVLG